MTTIQHLVDLVHARLHVEAMRLSTASVGSMLAVHAVLVASACWLAFSRRRWTTTLAAIAVLASGVVWLGINGRWEGRVFYEISPDHGVTEADLQLPALIALALAIRGVRAVARAWAERVRRRREAGVPTVLRTMWPRF